MLSATLLTLIPWTGTASAHGSVIDRHVELERPVPQRLRQQLPGGVPDGQLCSGGHTEGNRYNSLDTVGAWQTTNIGNKFTVKLYDQASHGADYFLVYVSRQGYDPTTQPLKWSDLQQVAKTGKYGPSQNYSIDVSTSGHTGRHVVYTIWQASHMDQTYFLCSDVNFS